MHTFNSVDKFLQFKRADNVFSLLLVCSINHDNQHRPICCTEVDLM
jgi:hypothetical protein